MVQLDSQQPLPHQAERALQTPNKPQLFLLLPLVERSSIALLCSLLLVSVQKRHF